MRHSLARFRCELRPGLLYRPVECPHFHRVNSRSPQPSRYARFTLSVVPFTGPTARVL